MQQIRIFISNKRLGLLCLSILLFLSFININLNYMKIIVSPMKSKINSIQFNYDYNVPITTATQVVTTTLPLLLCNELSNNYFGPLIYHPPLINSVSSEILGIREQELIKTHNDLEIGGLWSPKNCTPVYRVAIVVPYRDRMAHLLTFLNILLPILKKQRIQFQIFVVEQVGNETFNKGRIMNAGYQYIKRLPSNYKCFIFHDVDLVPEDGRNMYNCGVMPRHMSPAVDTLQYLLPYQGLVGGVLALTDEHFEQANGYSNSYWGWGGEDDDFYSRLVKENFVVERPPMQIGRYKMLQHDKRPPEPNNLKLLSKVNQLYKLDGLTQLNETSCKIISATYKHLYTHILIDVGEKSVVELNESKKPIETNETAPGLPSPAPNIWLLLRKY